MPNTIVDLTNTIFPNDRTDLRRFIIECFLNEPPGQGTEIIRRSIGIILKNLQMIEYYILIDLHIKTKVWIF